MQIEKPDCIEEKAKVLLHDIMYDIDCINEDNINYLPDLLRGKLIALYSLKLISRENFKYLHESIHKKAVDLLKQKLKEVIK